MAGTSDGAGAPGARGAPGAPGAIVDGRPPRGSVPGGGAAAWVNGWRLTARAYEPLWRRRSVGLLTRGAFSTARELKALVAWTAPAAGAEVLDVGCSAGLYARTLAAAGANVHALDASRPFLEEAARLAARDGVSLSLVQGDAHALPFADDRFDAVVVGATLNELADPARALGEIARVLRPAGRAWFMYARRAGPLGRPLQALMGWGGLRFPAPDELDAWAGDAGLVPIRSEERGAVVLALYGLGRGAPDVAATSPSPGWEGPTPRRNRRFNWERRLDGEGEG
ncbi:MAG: class I SAM-dependent methyltransferase [Trueperaceae bacterium]